MPATARAAGLAPAGKLERYAFGCLFVSSTAGFVSIAVSHLFLGLALALWLASLPRVRPPAAWLPLAGFLIWTGVSMFASGEPAAGLPQVKKLFVFAILPLGFALFRRSSDARRLFEAWFIVGGVMMTVAIVQFIAKWGEANRAGVDFLEYYTPDRITGFFSHWMTFSEAGMLIAALLASYLLFSPEAKRGLPVWGLLGAALLAGLALSYTRSVWLALAGLAVYFAIVWQPRLLWATPVVALLIAFAAPASVHERLRSTVDPSQNENRLLMWTTGLRMIEARPVFGVGPERVGPLFDDYAPALDGPKPDGYYGHLHNIYIHYAAERGLPALALLLAFLGRVLWDAARALRRLPPGRDDRRFLLHGMIAATFGVMAVGMFDLTLGDSEVLGAYLAVVALGYRAVAESWGKSVSVSAAAPKIPAS